MRPPDFWRHSEGRASAPVLRLVLSPVAALYAWVSAEKIRRATPAEVSVPVICIGNVTLGGTGKTPIVRALGKMFNDEEIKDHTLLRGHGGKEHGPTQVLGSHTAEDVGDEALLHARDRPTWVSRDRVAGAEAAIAKGAEVILMDDGFQNPSLAKDLSILVFDAEAGLGNNRVFPTGPLREPLEAALERCDLVVLMRLEPAAEKPDWLSAWNGPVVEAWLEPAEPPPEGPLVAFAGIGRPEKFFDTLKRAGGELAEAVPFPDHHVFAAHDYTFLAKLAKERGARLITTEKDFVRLDHRWREEVTAFPVRAHFVDEAPLREALQPILARILEAG